MDVQNYISFAEFSITYPINNHSSRVYLPIIKEDPFATDRENYVDRTYLAEGYIS